MYKVNAPEAGAVKLVKIVLAAAQEVAKAIKGLENLRRSRRVLDAQ